MDKQPHGGKRSGAGRKRLNVKSLSITLTEDDIAYLQTLDKNLSAAVRHLIAAARKS